MKQKFTNIKRIAFAILTFVMVGYHATYATTVAGKIKTRVIGEGQPVIMIPGLTCDGSVWNETIEAMGNGYQYHVMTLPGFAGNEPLADVEAGFFKQVGAMVLDYIDQNKIKKPIIIGHSLGGFMALNIAIKRPNLPLKLVIVDSLPYLTKIQMPQAETPEQAKQMAKQMTSMVLASANQPRANKVAYQKQMLQTMIIDKDKIEIAAGWGADSDTPTVAQSMYEMYTTDIRAELTKIKVPTLVLGAWVAYAPYGNTRESTLARYTEQYEKLANVTIDMTDIGNHFIMWDDPEFFYGWLKKFL